MRTGRRGRAEGRCGARWCRWRWWCWWCWGEGGRASLKRWRPVEGSVDNDDSPRCLQTGVPGGRRYENGRGCRVRVCKEPTLARGAAVPQAVGRPKFRGLPPEASCGKRVAQQPVPTAVPTQPTQPTQQRHAGAQTEGGPALPGRVLLSTPTCTMA
jgi:hypothetical protein